MALATLSIDLVAKLASFEADLGKAVRLSEKAAASIKSGFESIGEIALGNFIANFASQAVSALATIPGEMIESIALFKELEDKTGASAEALAQLQSVAIVSGTSLESIAQASVKLTTNLSKVDDESKGVGFALKTLGIESDNLRKLSPEQQFLEIAKALDKFKDGAGKTAAATAILGKSGADMLPFFKDLAEAGELQVHLTQEQIERADELTKQQDRLKASIKSIAQVVVVESLPAYTALTASAKDAVLQFLGLDTATGKLDPKKVADFADSAGRALAVVVDAVDGVVRSFQVAGKTIGGAAAAAALAAQGDFRAAAEAIAAAKEDIDAVMQAPLFSDRFDAELKKVRDGIKSIAQGTDKPVIDFKLPDQKALNEAAREAKKEQEAYEKLDITIKERIALADYEIVNGRRMSEADRAHLEGMANLEKMTVKLLPQRRAYIESLLDEQRAKLQLIESTKIVEEAQKRDAEFEQSVIASYEASTQAIADENRALGDLIQTYGMTRQEVDQLAISRLQGALGRKEDEIATARMIGQGPAVIMTMQAEAAELKKQIDLRAQLANKNNLEATDPMTGATRAVTDYLERIGQAGEATRALVGGALQSLEDNLTSVFSGGKVNVKSFIDTLIAEYTRLNVIRPLMQSLLGDGKGGGLFGSVLSSISGGGGDLFGTLFSFISGGRAGGGDVSAGRMYEVNERGPETLQIGNRTLLMMGNKSGRVSPNSAGRGGDTYVDSRTYHVAAGVTRNEVASMLVAQSQATEARMWQRMRNERAV